MIPSPNLDDRSFDDIVEEAIRLIPQYCPTWTNFNKADPGITLLELFAWMTEMVIYRLNRVPDKNYLAFLNMLGMELRPPQPARTIVQFEVSEKIDQLRLPAGTRLTTKPADDQPALLFETEQDLVAMSNKLVRCMSQYNQMFSDNTPFVAGQSGAFEVFGGARSIERYIYLGDARFSAFSEDAILIVRFEQQSAGEREFPDLLEWEHWDGARWRELVRAPMELERNTVAFYGPAVFEPTAINEVESWWIRGRLFELPESEEETVLDVIQARLEILGEGVRPEHAISNFEGGAFQTLDLDKNFLPFGKAPQVDATLYLASEEVLGQPDTLVRIDVELSDQTVAEAPRASADLVLRWEYFNGKRWKVLGRCKAADHSVETEHEFTDGTRCFTESGSVSFRRPSDLAAGEAGGTEALFIRCRLELGSYGTPGTYELDDDTWVWKDDNPLRPPHLKSLVFKFQEEAHFVERCLVYNDFIYADNSKVAATEYKPFQVFQPATEESPTLFLGWEAPFPNETCQIYFNVVDADLRGGRAAVAGFEDRGDRSLEQRVVWEYWNGKTWQAIAPRDSTENFTQPGFIEFTGPPDFRKSRRFGDSLYWMRARLEVGGYDEAPRVDCVMLNAVYASNLTTYGETMLGSSAGTPNQRFSFPRAPVLNGEVITVLEPERPMGAELEQVLAFAGEEGVVEDPDGGGWFVVWRRADSLFDAGPRDRVYTKDIQTAEVRFGDGVRGLIPPKGEKNVRARRYQVGGGSAGNVPAHTIIGLSDTIAFVNGVTNPYPAGGGCDMESVEDAKQRSPHILKARNRAVTAEDFEWLAQEASTSVARVKCLPSSSREGEVTVIVVPRAPLHAEIHEKPMPTAELLKRVRSYLSERKLVSTVVNVVRPAYVELSVDVEFVRTQAGASDRIKRGIERALRKFLHPLYGGRNSTGWPFGRAVLKIDLYQVIEDVDGVDFVDKVRLFDDIRGVEVEQLKMSDDQLVHLVNVNATEKAHDRII
ncbi:MAG: putative baseplate assembly protein [Deltaproteobacteria bacterium]|nr:putative baseplate assembly protein [Deltaproteobacteria bacterium]MCB9785934.1 putative baseplate assembly protein [Deltaproteobacteria bacterium]